jgi:DNA modification methylase
VQVMDPVIVVGGARVFHGDCREVLQGLPDNSVDSIVTDPPYELGFMGKKWDSSGIAYDVTVWAECLRVLKPGGHILAFGGSRTWHRLAVAVEDAGFEIRDNIAWIYGSGFPKSLDVSKAIDKTNGEGGRRYKFTGWMRTTGLTSADIDRITGTNMGGHYLTAKSQPAIPTVALWEMLRPHCGDVPAWVDELVARVEAEREVIGQKTGVAGSGFGNVGHGLGSGLIDETAPATSEAKAWEGWGTALKPAHEPIVVGRKPLVGTVAENVLTWGVGGLNIDGSRISHDGSGSWGRGSRPGGFANVGAEKGSSEPSGRFNAQGRWPANVIFDEVTAGLLDEQSGQQKDGRTIIRNPEPGATRKNNIYGKGWGKLPEDKTYGGSGGASRFFYVAKASKRDRNEGLEELEAQRHADRVVHDGPGGENLRNRTNTAKQNFHPTVKPTQLMRYLIKLVTPPGGTVLDPFTGSGSTGKAALLDGFQFVGVELTEEYLPIIEGRLQWAIEQGDDDDTLF